MPSIDTAPRADRIAYARYCAEVANGTAAARIRESNISADRLNYRQMISSGTYGEVIGILAMLAQLDDIYATAASQAISSISPTLNDWQIMAGIAGAFSEFIVSEWYDVREATGPEAGRPSRHRYSVELATAATLHLALSEITYSLALATLPGPGWCLKALALEVPDVQISAFPKSREAIFQD